MRLKMQASSRIAAAGWRGQMLLFCGLLLPLDSLAVGTWTKLAQGAPGNICLMLLLSDGRVMAFNNPQGTIGQTPDGIGQGYWFLNPDSQGNYVNGTWTYPASKMHDSRLWFPSQVLTNGNVFVAGGEYGQLSAGPFGNPVPGNGYARAEVYDPVADIWTQVNPPPSLLDPSADTFGHPLNGDPFQGFVDALSEMLPNGSVLIAPVSGNSPVETMIYNPANNSWCAGGNDNEIQDENSWVKLPDGSILTINASTNTSSSERYIPSLNQWVTDSNVPVPMFDSFFETGPGLLMTNGNVIFFGGTTNTVIYTPSPLGGTNQGTWTPGPPIPQDPQGNPLAAQDLPAAMMVNGKILCVFGHLETRTGGAPPPVFFFEFDPSSNAFTEVGSPTGGLSDNGSSFTDFFGDNVNSMMLDLPNGQVLYSHQGGDLYVYTPDGSPLPSGKPVIRSVGFASDGSVLLKGTLFNGISEGATFGDDAQMNSNYPLVRVTDGSGNVYYVRTHDWSSTGVQSTNIVATECDLTFESRGQYTIQVVANGIASEPWTYKAPDVWVDFTDVYSADFGNYFDPYMTLAEGISAVPSGGTIAIKGPSLDYSAGPDVSSETPTINTPMTIMAVGGPVTIGHHN